MSAPPSVPPSDVSHRAGDRIGRWELVRCVGVGGMGSVWEARHESLRRRVAIKFIHAAYASDAEARVRFENEARAASALQSRHAVEMFDHGVAASGEPFIVMEYLVGESLEQRIREQGRLPLAVTSTIVTQVCRALQQAHDLGIVHRDLKPENIFLSPDEEPGAFVAKVLDFGVAKVSGANALLADAKTKTGALLGTPYYMAPEQARGVRSIDGRADVWSLGVVAYRCVTGELPFDAEALGELLVRICTGTYTPPSRVRADLPKAFDAWMALALGVEPRQRFATATELAEALAEVVSSEGNLERTFSWQLSRHAASPRHPSSPGDERTSERVVVANARVGESVPAFAATRHSLPAPPRAEASAQATQIALPAHVLSRRRVLLGALALAVAASGGAFAIASRARREHVGAVAEGDTRNEADPTTRASRERPSPPDPSAPASDAAAPSLPAPQGKAHDAPHPVAPEKKLPRVPATPHPPPPPADGADPGF